MLTLSQLLFDFDTEEDSLPRLQAALMFSFWAPPGMASHPSRVNVQWLALAITIAKDLGLHQKGDVGIHNKHLAKRIWWSCVIRNVVLAFTYRRAPIVRRADYNTDPLLLEDVLDGFRDSLVYPGLATQLVAKMFMSLADLARRACRLLEDRYCPQNGTTPLSDLPQSNLDAVLDMERFNTELEIWRQSFLADDLGYLNSEDGTHRPLILERNFILILHR